jgi:hypothetical protein
LNDTTSIRTLVRVSFASTRDSTMIHRRNALLQKFPLQIFAVQTSGVVDGVGELPPNIHLLTFRIFREKVLLLRLQHIYSEEEHPELSVPGTVDLHKFLSPKVKFTEISETNLVGTVAIEQLNKMKWKTSSQSPDADFRYAVIRNFVLRVMTSSGRCHSRTEH